MNVQGVTDLVTSKVNKVIGGVGEEEGAVGERKDALDIEVSDDELIKRARKVADSYSSYYGKIKPKQKKNLEYYLGRQMENYATDGTPIAKNLIFESLETYLAAAFAKNPEPVVYSDNSTEGNKLSKDIQTMLSYHADVLCLRQKLKLMVRQHSIYYLGVLKYGWDDDISEVQIENRRIQDFIFDPEGYVDVYGDFHGDVGEIITKDAQWLVDQFPKHAQYIRTEVGGKMATLCTFTEWWTDEICFYTFKDIILEKHKNEFFNYEEEEEVIPGVFRNHFSKPKKPYTFLSVYSLEEQPHDITGLIEQNIANQNLVSRETIQIDYNVSRANNSTAYSENNFTQQTAKQAAQARLKGHPLLVPPGVPIAEAIHDLPANPVPGEFFKFLEMNTEALRSTFGTQGITAQEPTDNTTARGMILNQQYDNTRIGGGIGEKIERVADSVFNWLVQLYYVYYDEVHFGAVMGTLKATEYVQLSAQSINKKLVVSVAPDSMKPHDQITEVNQAVEFFQMGAIGPKTLLTIADFPDPDESASDGVLWKVAPMEYLTLNWPELAQKLQQMQQLQVQQQQAAQQQELAMQGKQAQQGLAIKDATAKQQLQHKQQAHEQKLGQAQQVHEQKISLASDPASAALKNVKLPKK